MGTKLNRECQYREERRKMYILELLAYTTSIKPVANLCSVYRTDQWWARSLVYVGNQFCSVMVYVNWTTPVLRSYVWYHTGTASLRLHPASPQTLVSIYCTRGSMFDLLATSRLMQLSVSCYLRKCLALNNKYSVIV